MYDMAEIQNIIISAAAVLSAVMLLPCLIRVLLGPCAADRITAISSAWVRISVILCAVPFFTEGEYLDAICVALTAIGFLIIRYIADLNRRIGGGES